jgi:hypothetical protein
MARLLVVAKAEGKARFLIVDNAQIEDHGAVQYPRIDVLRALEQ